VLYIYSKYFDRNSQCTYTVTLGSTRVPNDAMEKQLLLYIPSGCLYSCLSYPTCKLHIFCAAIYCHLCLSGSTILIHIIS